MRKGPWKTSLSCIRQVGLESGPREAAVVPACHVAACLETVHAGGSVPSPQAQQNWEADSKRTPTSIYPRPGCFDHPFS